MTQAERLVEYYGIIHRVIKRQLDGVTHKESLQQPPFRGNCLNWVLGHMVFSRGGVLKLLDEDLPWTENEAARYIRNSEPITGEENALPLEQLLDYLDQSQARILAGLQWVSAERMETVVDDQTVGERMTFSQWHETYHLGQLEPLRQLAGKNDKVI
jgi:hypothetical protein